MINRVLATVIAAALFGATSAVSAPVPSAAGKPFSAEASSQNSGKFTPLSQDDLSAISAGQSPTAIALTNQNLTAVNSGNLVTAQNIATGQVSFANGAFQGFTGIGNFVINTGNNNNLQGSLSVTVIPLQ